MVSSSRLRLRIHDRAAGLRRSSQELEAKVGERVGRRGEIVVAGLYQLGCGAHDNSGCCCAGVAGETWVAGRESLGDKVHALFADRNQYGVGPTQESRVRCSQLGAELPGVRVYRWSPHPKTPQLLFVPKTASTLLPAGTGLGAAVAPWNYKPLGTIGETSLRGLKSAW